MKKNLDTIFGITLIIAVLAMAFLFFSRDKEKENRENGENKIDVPKMIKIGDETIDLSWTDDNQGEDLIIQSDKKSYFGIDRSEVYFSLTNTNKKDQKIDLRFLFANKEAGLSSIVKIEGGKETKMEEVNAIFEDKDGFVSSDYFGDAIKTGETAYYKAAINYPANSEGEFYIEAKGDNGAYGLLDPWYNSTGLVGYWSMDGDDVDWSATTAEVIDRSGQGNHGDAFGMSSANAYIGKSGQALDFGGSGSGDYIVPPSSDLNTYINDTTVVAWVKFDNHAGASFTPIYNNNTSGNANLNIYMDVSADRLRCLSGNSAGDVITTLDISDNVWYLAACTRSVSDNQLKLYVDGVLKATDSYLTARTYNAGSPVAIGTSAYSQGNYLFDGKIDELAVFNHALSTDEISALYKLGNRKTQTNSSNVDRLTSGLVGHWTFDGVDMDWSATTAEVIDRSGQGNHGDVAGDTKSTIGEVGQGLIFDGTGDYVDAGTNLGLNVSGAITVSAWIYPNSLAAFMPVISKVDYATTSNNNGWELVVGTHPSAGRNNEMDFVVANNDWDYSVSADYSITTGEWQHIIALWDGNSSHVPKLYRNGVELSLDLSTISISSIGAATNSAKIGSNTISGRSPFDGKIDEVRVYNRALSTDEIIELYQMGEKKLNVNTSSVNRLTSGLVGHWTFDGADMDWSATTAEVIDRSGQGNNGDATNIDSTNVTIGKTGQSLNFNGSNEYINVANSSSVNMTTNPFTINTWFYAETKGSATYGAAGTLVQKGCYGGTWNGYIFGFTDTDPIHLYAYFSSATPKLTGSKTISLNEWHMATLIMRSPTDYQILLDGEVDVSGSSALSSLSNTRALTIGSREGSAWNFDGKIDEVRIYNRDLSMDEITELYQMGEKKLKIKQ